MDQFAVKHRASDDGRELRAVRVELHNTSAVAAWCGGKAESRARVERPGVMETTVAVPNGDAAAIGDWIVRDGGVFTVYEHEAFMKEYQPA